MTASNRLLGSGPHTRSDPDRTALELHRLVRDAVARRERLVVLPAGVHRVAGGLLPDRWCDISNHDSGWKRVLFDLDGARDLVIDGAGCRIVVEDATLPLRLARSTRVTVRGLTIDWARPGYSEAEVLASGPGSVELAATPGLAADRGRLRATGAQGWPGDHLWCAVAFDAARREPLPGAAEHWHLERQHRATGLPGGRIRLDAAWGAGAPPAGSTLVLMHGDRVAPAIAIDGCTTTVIEDVTVHHALGMGVIAQTSRDITLRRFRCVPPPGRLTSSWVDATHFADCDGDLRLLECDLGGMFDDGSNIHGAFRRVVARPEPDLLWLRAEHPQQEGIAYARPGDRLALHAASTLARVAEAEVRSVEPINRRVQALRLSRPIDVAADSGSLVAMRYAPDTLVEVRGCRIAPVRGRGLLLQVPGRIVVEDNRFHTSGNAIVALCDATYWYESGPVEDLLVRGNVFDACAYGPCGADLVQVLPESASGGFAAPVMGRVHVVDNEIRRASSSLLRARAVADLAFDGNRIAWHEGYPRRDAGPAVQLGEQIGLARIQPLD